MATMTPEKEKQAIREYLSRSYPGGIVPEDAMSEYFIGYNDDQSMFQVFKRSSDGVGYEASMQWIKTTP